MNPNWKDSGGTGDSESEARDGERVWDTFAHDRCSFRPRATTPYLAAVFPERPSLGLRKRTGSEGLKEELPELEIETTIHWGELWDMRAWEDTSFPAAAAAAQTPTRLGSVGGTSTERERERERDSMGGKVDKSDMLLLLSAEII